MSHFGPYFPCWLRGPIMKPSNAVVFCSILKKSEGNLYMSILDLYQLYVADASMNNKKDSFTTSQSIFVLGR